MLIIYLLRNSTNIPIVPALTVFSQ